jgi:Zn-finger nucleic acid-binding protein
VPEDAVFCPQCDGVVITDGNVDRAIEDARELVGPEFAALLEGRPPPDTERKARPEDKDC